MHSLLSGHSETVSQSSLVSLSDKEDYSSHVQLGLDFDSDTSKVSDYQLSFSDVGEENETPGHHIPVACTSSSSSIPDSADILQRDPQHALTKKYYWNQQGGRTVSYDDLALVQDLVVLDSSEVRPRQLYRFS